MQMLRVGLILLMFGVSVSSLADDAVDHDELPVSRVAFGSCAKESVPQPIWSAVSEAWRTDDTTQGPEVWVWAGDNIYGDSDDVEVIRRKWAQLSAVPGYAAVRDSVRAVLGTWDDHDYGRNDAGREYPIRAQSQQLFLDFLGVSSDSPRRQREGVYHAATFGPLGQRLQIILLDTRYHRSELERYEAADGERRAPYKPSSDPEQSMLGEAQWQWLERRLQEPADVRLIVSSIQFVSDEHRFEKWSNLPRERSRMLRLIEDTGAGGVIFLSGDRHHAELSKLVRVGDYPLWDLTASGLTQSRPRSDASSRPLEINRHRVGRHFRGHHFGTISIDWEQPDPTVRLAIHDQNNANPIEHTLKLSELQPSPRTPFFAASHDDNDRLTPISKATLTVDGDHRDWPSDQPALLAADDDHLYVRFTTPDERTLARHGESVLVLLNTDGNRTTGVDSALAYGTDLSLEFGLPQDDSVDPPLRGPRVKFHHAGAESDAVTTGDIGLHVQPTFASRHFELRLDRDTAAAQRVGLNQAGSVELTVAGRDTITGRLRPLMRSSAVLPEPASEPSDRQPGMIPDKPDDALRFVVWNVLWAQPRENPPPFSRIFRALDADVALLQEWDRSRYREADIERWFTEHVDAGITWSSMVTGSGGRGSGTAVVSRYPMLAKLPPHTPVEADRWDFPARIAGAAIDTPLGRVVATSVHFKAGGFLDHPTDTRRLAEANVANRLTQGLVAVTTPDVTVFAGDFNMNGTTRLLNAALRGLDEDQSPLTLARPAQVGDPGLVYTFGWGDNKRRLDYLAYSDATAEVVNGFVLDTQSMHPAALAAAGLEPDDAHASDHFPVVVDLRITRQPRHRLAAEPAVMSEVESVSP
ncbi:MAG: alkaline phosphatase D family protein [Planctomycetota bacterium]